MLRFSECRRTSAQDEDEDVAAERQRMHDGGSKTDILQIRDLSKVRACEQPPASAHHSALNPQLRRKQSINKNNHTGKENCSRKSIKN